MAQTGLFSPWTLAAGLWLLFWLGAALLPLMTLGRVLSAHKNPLEGHLAGQLLRLGSLTAAVQLLGLLPMVALFWEPLQDVLPLPEVQGPATAVMALTLAATLLSIGMGLSWKALRKKKGTAWLLVLTLGLFLGALWPLITLLRRLLLDTGGTASLFTNNLTLSLPWFSSGWPVSMQTVLLGDIWLYGPGVAGGLSLIWLLLRRTKDDFGRDYYGFAVRVCASFAAFGGLLGVMNTVSLSQSLIGLFGKPMVPELLLPAWLTMAGEHAYTLLGAETVLRMGLSTVPHALGFLCLLLPAPSLLAALLWFVVARAAVPMRHKLGMLIGFVCYAGGILLALDLFRLAHSLVLTSPLP